MTAVRVEDRRSSAEERAEKAARARSWSFQALALVLLSALVVVASSGVRHRLAEAVATVCVVGGFIAAPLLTITAWIGLALPQRVPLHSASNPLFVAAIIWLALAFIGAHLHQGARSSHRSPDLD
jgi:hypothetical protein